MTAPTAYVQGLLGDDEPVGLQRLAPVRTTLSAGAPKVSAAAEQAWIDVQRGWVTGSGELLERLMTTVPWRAERRQMYDRVVDVPRLVSFYDAGEHLPHPLLTQARSELSGHYAQELGEEFATAGLCLYRDGRDSVAWHGDTIGRAATTDTMVALLCCGGPRMLALRARPGVTACGSPDVTPEGTGAQRGHQGSLRISLGPGDLLVMGGSCQRTWEHAVPKTARRVGARISVQFRTLGVR